MKDNSSCCSPGSPQATRPPVRFLEVVKSEVLETDHMRSFGAILEPPPSSSPALHSMSSFLNPSAPQQLLPSSGPTLLQRYHSAPSAFLHSHLYSTSPNNEDGVSCNSCNSSKSSPFFSHGLTAISEQISLDTERLNSTSAAAAAGHTNLEENFDQYIMFNPSNFGKPGGGGGGGAAAAMNMPSAKSEANWHFSNDILVHDPFESFFPPPKNSTSHAAAAHDLSAARQDVDERSSPMGMTMTTTTVQSMIMSSEESVSGTSEDTNYYGHHGSLKANRAPTLFPRDDDFLLSDSLNSLNLPTSPGDASGKRHCGNFGEPAETSCETAEGPMMRSRVPGVQPGSLKRQMSLPVAKTHPPDVAFVQSVIPSHSTRAKRGCATHPRSIAERVRRTRISERMKKLQQVVPNMDKQTNTSEMLDEAVEYVKSLQKKVQELTHTVAELRGQNHS